MIKTLKSVEISEMPTQIDLQFNVRTNGEKDPKYSQKQIFESNKKEVARRKGLSKEERINLSRAEVKDKRDKNIAWRKATGRD
tara:strand:+ start:2020 stop:2268 length:249 start_codon:yes stop_codon:yes gene_type:complete